MSIALITSLLLVFIEESKNFVKAFIAIVILVILSISLAIYSIMISNNKELPISLPEEISQAGPGDVLEVYKVSDSIYVQFKHIRENSDSPVILWNDDPESIPVDGTKVELQHTENDTIYIGNLE